MIFIKKEILYIWLSIIECNYLTYLRLIKVFGNVSNIFYYSNNKEKFLNILLSNSITLSKNLIDNLINEDLKKLSLKLYNYLVSNNFIIISIKSKNYPKKLFNLFNPPICIFLNKNIDLNKKLIFLHYDENFSPY